MGQAAGDWTGVLLQLQPSPRGLTRASLGFLAAWLPPATPTAWVVIEGLVDSIPVESFIAFLPNPGSPAASLLPLCLGYMRVTHWTDLREDMDPTFQGDVEIRVWTSRWHEMRDCRSSFRKIGLVPAAIAGLALLRPAALALLTLIPKDVPTEAGNTSVLVASGREHNRLSDSQDFSNWERGADAS